SRSSSASRRPRAPASSGSPRSVCASRTSTSAWSTSSGSATAKRWSSAGTSARRPSPGGTASARGSRAGNRSTGSNRHSVLALTEFWQHLFVAAAMVAIALAVAKAVDWRIARRDLAPEAVTRYRVLRRSVVTAIVFVGFMSSLLVIPQVRAVAGGVLASSAVVGLVIGFASQRTIGNVVAGILIAITQPLRLGDVVEVQGVQGIGEEIGLTSTWIRTPD